MFYNYLKIILRNMMRDGVYNFIIVFGLAMGIAATLIIAQYIHFELSFDSEYKHDEDTYMAYMRWDVLNSGQSFDINTHPGVATVFAKAVPEVDKIARMVPISFSGGHDWNVRRPATHGEVPSLIHADYLFYADAPILDIFSINLLKGDPKTALREPKTAILSQNMADRLFPDGDALGGMIQLQSYGSMTVFTIVGVAAPRAANSTIQFNALLSLASFPSANLDDTWDFPVYKTYLRLHQGSDPSAVEQKINKAAEARLQKEELTNGIRQRVRLHPFSSLHFYEPYNNSAPPPVHFSGDKRLLLYFGILAALILIICWANYINLTTARALRRAKEVGLRKVNGAKSIDVIKQFLLEFLFMNLVSMVAAFTMAQLLFDTFATAIGSKAQWTFWTEPLFWVIVVVFLLVSTLASGLYPAFVLAGYNPANVLKGNFANSQRGLVVRRGLVLIQFTLAVLLLTSIYVISSQVFFMQHRDLGQSTDRVLVVNAMEIDTSVSRTDAYLRWKTRLNELSLVKNTTATQLYPGQSEMIFRFYRRPEDPQQRIGIQTHPVSENYLKTMNIPLLYGREFIDDRPGESNKVVLSTHAATELGFIDLRAAVGQRIQIEGDSIDYEVIGITRDFMTSMKTPVFGHAFKYRLFSSTADHYNYFMVSLAGNEVSRSIAALEKEWATLFPETPFDYFFLNQFLRTLYTDEYQFAGVFAFFSIIGVVITCMGLYGLSLFNTTVRTKEIGIRKSLGGSIQSIMWLLSSSYLKLIMVASLIALPLGIWQLESWLKTYPNRISLGPDVIIVPIVTALAISMFTVGYHTYQAAKTNPVRSLRAE